MNGHWTAEQNGNYSGGKLSGWIIRYDPTPGGKKNADGSTSYSLNFPALALTDIVAEPETSARAIAATLECHDDLVEALKAAEQFIANGVELGFIRMPDPETPDSAHETLPTIRAALARAKAAA